MWLSEPLTTDRLRLRPIGERDRRTVVRLRSDPQVRLYLGGARSPAEVEAELARDEPLGTTWGEFAVADLRTDRALGVVSLSRDRGELEVTWVFLPECWGTGYAQEAVTAVIAWAFAHGQDERIIAITRSANAASCRLAVRLGMERERVFEQYGAEQVQFALERARFSSGGVPRLAGPNVVLRAPRDGDVDDRLRLGRDPEIGRMYGAAVDDQPLTREQVTGWFERLREHPHGWVIEVDGRAVGTARIDGIVEDDARGSLAVGIDDPSLLGRGLGTEAIELLLEHAFERLRLHRLSLRVLEYNTRAIRAYASCGFVVEGREREAALVGGERSDDLLMGLLAHEWRASRAGRPPQRTHGDGGTGQVRATRRDDDPRDRR